MKDFEGSAIVDLNLSGVELCRDDFTYLQRMETLSTLRIDSLFLDRDLLKGISECTNLEGLSLRGARNVDRLAVETLAHMNLKSLVLVGSDISKKNYDWLRHNMKNCYVELGPSSLPYVSGSN